MITDNNAAATTADDDTTTATNNVSVLPTNTNSENTSHSSSRCPTPYRNENFLSVLLYCLIYFLLSSDQNLMAPNLTAIAIEFYGPNFTSTDRDLYLGGYITAAFYGVGAVTTLIIGNRIDIGNRKLWFTVVVLAGEIASSCTMLVEDFWGLFATRAFVGIAIGGTFPILMSMLSDQFPIQQRGKMCAVLGLLNTLGLLFGQVIASSVGPDMGWRVPFLIVAVPNLVLAPIFYCFTDDPKRAVQDIDLDEGELYAETVTWDKIKALLRNPTAMAFCISSLPSSLPFGVVLVYLQDWLVQDISPQIGYAITTENSVFGIIAFAIGGIFGTIFGGWMVDVLWKRDAMYVALALALSTVLALVPYLVIVNVILPSLAVYCIVAVPMAFLALISGGGGSNAVLLNVTVPEVRGSVTAIAQFWTSIGIAVAPIIIGAISATMGRVTAFNWAAIGLAIAGLMILATTVTINKDYNTMRAKVMAGAKSKNENVKSTTPHHVMENISIMFGRPKPLPQPPVPHGHVMDSISSSPGDLQIRGDSTNDVQTIHCTSTRNVNVDYAIAEMQTQNIPYTSLHAHAHMATSSPALTEELVALQSMFEHVTCHPVVDSRVQRVVVVLHAKEPARKLVVMVPDDYPNGKNIPVVVSGLQPGQVLSAFEKGQTCLVAWACEALLLLGGDDGNDVELEVTDRNETLVKEMVSTSGATLTSLPALTSQRVVEDEWVKTSATVVQKSTFVGFAASCTTVEDAKELLEELLRSKHTGKATHSMWAYRIIASNNQTLRCDNDDDGEAGAGAKLAELLHRIDAKNVVVVVSRWYGGIQLGPQRFKIIATVGMEALRNLRERDDAMGKGVR